MEETPADRSPPIDAISKSLSDSGTGLSLIDRLHGGLSDSHVFLAQRNHELVVLKVQQDNREHQFLTQFAPRVFPRATWLPRVIDNGNVGHWNWLLLEHIPNAWPRERFDHDAAALQILKTLHSTAIGLSDFDWAPTEWTPEQLGVTKAYLPSKDFDTICGFYETYLSRESENLSLCSGDPNAPNWLLRENGEPVLIDWQIVTHANRALDLAGWMSTFLHFDEIREIANIYLGPQDDPAKIDVLTSDIALFFCRRVAMNFWRAENSHNPDLWKAGIEASQQAFPTWLRRVATHSCFPTG